jgi:hypothetical protein
MPAINWSEINWLAVIVAGLAAFMLGGVWYTALFGKAWQTAHGFTAEAVKQAQAAMSPAKFFGGMLLCYLLVAMGMAILSQWTGTNTLVGGAWLGGLVGVLIVMPVVLTNHLPSMVKPAGFFIDAAFAILFCKLIGMIIAVWH